MPPVIRAKLGPKRRPGSAPGAEGKRYSEPETRAVPLPAGLAARDMALWLVGEVLDRRRAFDDALAEAFASARGLAMSPRDRALSRLIAATVLRRRGTLETLLAGYMEKPLGERHIAAQRGHERCSRAVDAVGRRDHLERRAVLLCNALQNV